MIDAATVSPLRVLLLVHEFSVTGAPLCVLNLFESMTNDLELRILAPNAGPLQQRFSELGPVTLTDPMLAAAGTLARVRRKIRVKKLESALLSWSPHLIYVNSVSSLQLLQRVRLPARVPILLHVHELEEATKFLLQGKKELLTDYPASYIAVSGAVDEMLRRDYGVDCARIANIPEAIPDAFVVNATARSGRSTDRILVGGAGAMDVRKGVVLWLQMAVEVAARLGRNRVRFRWVGASDSFESRFCAGIAAKLGIGEIVEFVPVTNDPASHFCEFDVFAMTSWEDPCPLVVLENMGLGVPVVCFAGGGGAPEQIGDTGLTVAGFSPTAMASAVIRLIEDPERRTALGEAAAARFLERFTVSVVGPKVLAEMKRAALQ